MRLSQGLLPYMGLLQKMFPSILDMKNANRAEKIFLQNRTEDRITYFNISVTVKRRRDNNITNLTYFSIRF